MITLNHLIPFPLTTLIIGGHEPDWAEDRVEYVSALDDETLATIMGYMIIVAREEMTGN